MGAPYKVRKVGRLAFFEAHKKVFRGQITRARPVAVAPVLRRQFHHPSRTAEATVSIDDDCGAETSSYLSSSSESKLSPNELAASGAPRKNRPSV